jgi:hypothetical protein
MWGSRIKPRIINAIILSFMLVLNCVKLFLWNAHACINIIDYYIFFRSLTLLSNPINSTFTMFIRNSILRWNRNHCFHLINLVHDIPTFVVFLFELSKQLIVLIQKILFLAIHYLHSFILFLLIFFILFFIKW